MQARDLTRQQRTDRRARSLPRREHGSPTATVTAQTRAPSGKRSLPSGCKWRRRVPVRSPSGGAASAWPRPGLAERCCPGPQREAGISRCQENSAGNHPSWQAPDLRGRQRPGRWAGRLCAGGQASAPLPVPVACPTWPQLSEAVRRTLSRHPCWRPAVSAQSRDTVRLHRILMQQGGGQAAADRGGLPQKSTSAHSGLPRTRQGSGTAGNPPSDRRAQPQGQDHELHPHALVLTDGHTAEPAHKPPRNVPRPCLEICGKGPARGSLTHRA